MGLPLVTRKARELGATPSIVGLIGKIIELVYSNPEIVLSSLVCTRILDVLIFFYRLETYFLLEKISQSHRDFNKST